MYSIIGVLETRQKTMTRSIECMISILYKNTHPHSTPPKPSSNATTLTQLQNATHKKLLSIPPEKRLKVPNSQNITSPNHHLDPYPPAFAFLPKTAK
jgi:hypothetical protein